LHDKKKVDSTEKIEVSHILLKVVPGTETIDSLMSKAELVRTSAKKIGLEKAAQEAKLPLEKSAIFEKSNLSPLGGAYVQGVNSFAFSQFEAKEKISEALQAEDGIYVLERDAKFEKGRNFERAKPLISALLVKEEKLALAKKELEAQKGAISSAGEGPLPARLGKAVLDSTASGPISADNWLTGFGYSSPVLFQVFNQPVGAWGPVLTTEIGSVMAKVTEKLPIAEADIAAKVQQQLSQNDPYAASTIYQDFVTNLPKSAKVENKMDLVFRN
jgi:hypothetical protein